jgi:predicted  nucleic acid-binding Zn-ribbon protein
MNEDPTQRLTNSQDDTLAQILSAVQNLSSRVEGLERKVEERLYDTRPIWEKVQADIAQLQEGQQSLSEGQTSLSAGQKRLEEKQQRFEERLEALRDEVRTGFRDLKRQFSVLNDTFLEVRADYKDLDKRVYRLESRPT